MRIALIGKSGAGKSHLAGILAGQRGVTLVKTGAVCREIANLLFGNEDKSTTQKLDDVLTQLEPRAEQRGFDRATITPFWNISRTLCTSRGPSILRFQPCLNQSLPA